MDVHVIIATAGRSDLLRRTLESIAACPKPAGFKGVCVVENGGRNGVEDLLDEMRGTLETRYLFEPMGNKNRSLNRGLREIGGGLAILLDDDVRLAPDALVAYEQAAQRWPEAVFFGGACSCDYEQPPAEHIRKLLPLSAKGWDLGEDGIAIKLPHALGFNWAVRVEVVLGMGGFIEDRGPGTAIIVGDEYEMQERMIREHGPGRFVAQARVWHYVPGERCSVPWLLNRAYHYGRAKALMEHARHGTPGRGAPLWARRRLWTSTLKWLASCCVGNQAWRVKTSYGRRINQGLVDAYRQGSAPGV